MAHQAAAWAAGGASKRRNHRSRRGLPLNLRGGKVRAKVEVPYYGMQNWDPFRDIVTEEGNEYPITMTDRLSGMPFLMRLWMKSPERRAQMVAIARAHFEKRATAEPWPEVERTFREHTDELEPGEVLFTEVELDDDGFPDFGRIPYPPDCEDPEERFLAEKLRRRVWKDWADGWAEVRTDPRMFNSEQNGDIEMKCMGIGSAPQLVQPIPFLPFFKVPWGRRLACAMYASVQRATDELTRKQLISDRPETFAALADKCMESTYSNPLQFCVKTCGVERAMDVFNMLERSFPKELKTEGSPDYEEFVRLRTLFEPDEDDKDFMRWHGQDPEKDAYKLGKNYKLDFNCHGGEVVVQFMDQVMFKSESKALCRGVLDAFIGNGDVVCPDARMSFGARLTARVPWDVQKQALSMSPALRGAMERLYPDNPEQYVLPFKPLRDITTMEYGHRFPRYFPTNPNPPPPPPPPPPPVYTKEEMKEMERKSEERQKRKKEKEEMRMAKIRNAYQAQIKEQEEKERAAHEEEYAAHYEAQREAQRAARARAEAEEGAKKQKEKDADYFM